MEIALELRWKELFSYPHHLPDARPYAVHLNALVSSILIYSLIEQIFFECLLQAPYSAGY